MRLYNTLRTENVFTLTSVLLRIELSTLFVIDEVDDKTRFFMDSKRPARWPVQVKNFNGATVEIISTDVKGRASQQGAVKLDVSSLCSGDYILRLKPADGAWLRPDNQPDVSPVGPGDNHCADKKSTCRYRPLDIKISITIEESDAKVTFAALEPGTKHGAVSIGSVGQLIVDWKPDWVAYKDLAAADVNGVVDLLILHNTAESSIGSAANEFLSGAKGIHYLIDKDGFTVKMAPENVRVGHAGSSFWKGKTRLNEHSIGIEHVHAKGEAYTAAQITEAIRLTRSIRQYYPEITRHNVLGHADVNTTKESPYLQKAKPDCPGVDYDWGRLRAETLVTVPRTRWNVNIMYGGYFEDHADRKIGIKALDNTLKNSKGVTYGVIEQLQQDLKKIGYSINSTDGVTVTGTYDDATFWAVDRFQRRFLPHKIPKDQANGQFDRETATMLKQVLKDFDACGKCQECITYYLNEPRLIAVAQDKTIKTRVKLKVNDDVLKGGALNLGQDIQHSLDRKAPNGYSVGDDEQTLKTHMRRLLAIFAAKDSEGKAKCLFERFFEKNAGIEVFIDDALDKAIDANENTFGSFAELALAAPGTQGTAPDKVRIHQALEDAHWNVNHVRLIEDLGVPAFNEGHWSRDQGIPNALIKREKDYANGLKLMINGVQYVFIYVEEYDYSSCENQYTIKLKFVLYDVFGLDDDDLQEFGSASTHYATAAGIGFTAWWQLQHQFNYAPLLTRAVAYRTFVVSTVGK